MIPSVLQSCTFYRYVLIKNAISMCSLCYVTQWNSSSLKYVTYVDQYINNKWFEG